MSGGGGGGVLCGPGPSSRSLRHPAPPLRRQELLAKAVLMLHAEDGPVASSIGEQTLGYLNVQHSLSSKAPTKMYRCAF